MHANQGSVGVMNFRLQWSNNDRKDIIVLCFEINSVNFLQWFYCLTLQINKIITEKWKILIISRQKNMDISDIGLKSDVWEPKV